MPIHMFAERPRPVPILCLLFILLFAVPETSPAASAFKAVVTRVQDGDSLMAKPLHGRTREVRLRLYGIDAPELRQKDGKAAWEALQTLLPEGSRIDVTPMDRDSYHRTIVLVRRDSQLVNLAMVQQGAAWVYDAHCKAPICVDLKAAEAAARKQRAGLWRRKAPLPPWTWRERQR